ncbi:hypothetical protein ACFQBY_17040 [Promicromonospora citrea]|uniref:Uncharacterized protein n=1 Tax=Promicromonospora citrea TaxID=43677 RepID=A0A8H9GPA5_9MICO|nr:hypothetical protein [Promicromonospora citrea]NNH50957.1 hypothetical protein [Promicromonospora citrea]GGM41278.1 hypothetical protein GCM10010102_40990 [Promicromonospora citrea]
MTDEQTELPGDPRGVWQREAARDAPADDVWLPAPEDLAPWDTPEAVDAHYAPLPAWWQRWLLVILYTVVAGIAVASALPDVLPDDGTPVRPVAAVLAGLLGAGIVVAVAVGVVLEVRHRRTRGAELRRVTALLRERAIPVWAVLENRVRVSGSGDTVYDLQLVFDLRVPRGTLALQHRVAAAWLDAVARSGESLPTEFAWDAPVHGADVFGEPMRGVWIWSKGSVLPIQTLGLAVDDPRETDVLGPENVVFLRNQPRELRRRSRID